MDMNRLKYFVVLCDSSTMAEAADHLRISQPALSKAMKLLETELGQKLFISSGRRTLITDKGRLIAEKAKKLLLDLDSLAQDPRTEEQQKIIRIGSFEVFSTYFLGHLFSSNHLSEFNLQIRELNPGQLEAGLAQGEVDIGITYVPIPKQDLEFIKIKEIEMGIFGKDKVFGKFKFSDLPFVIPIIPIQGSPHKVKGLDGWPDDQISRKIKYQVELMETALELCRQGLAVAYFPRFVVELHNKQVKPQFALQNIHSPTSEKTKKQSVYLLKRKSELESAAFRKVAATLRKLK